MQYKFVTFIHIETQQNARTNWSEMNHATQNIYWKYAKVNNDTTNYMCNPRLMSINQGGVRRSKRLLEQSGDAHESSSIFQKNDNVFVEYEDGFWYCATIIDSNIKNKKQMYFVKLKFHGRKVTATIIKN